MSRWTETDGPRGDDYDARWRAMQDRGENPHGEVDCLERLGVGSVLDAGCGTGRIARELARRGHEVVGVDLDATMLDTARRHAPELAWVESDLRSIDLGRTFDAVVLAGNVMIFVDPGTEATVLERCAAHLVPGGRVIAGFQILPGRFGLTDYDDCASAVGLELVDRWATWDGSPFVAAGDYAVSVHRSVTPAG